MTEFKKVFKLSATAIVLCAIFATIGFSTRKKDKNISTVINDKKITKDMVVGIINFAHKHNYDLNTIYASLNEHNHNYSEFFDKLINLYINNKIELNKDDVHKLSVYEFGNYALGDLLFKTDFSNDNIDEDILTEILFDKTMSSEAKRIFLERDNPGMECFFKSGKMYGYTTSNLISFLTLRTYVELKRKE